MDILDMMDQQEETPTQIQSQIQSQIQPQSQPVAVSPPKPKVSYID
jgi:hypothetical protein